MHISKWAVLLSLFWILLSGFIEPLLLSFGALSVALVLLVLKRMDAVDGEQKRISANSITLTPGTLSVDLEDGKITVHALQAESIKELEEGDMESRIKKLWGSAK